MVNQGKPSSSDPKGKNDYSTAILERKLQNQLEDDEATNDDNSVVALHPDTMELLQIFYNTQIHSGHPKKPKNALSPRPTSAVRPIRGPLEPAKQSLPRSRPPC
jgi:hypothetical protein